MKAAASESLYIYLLFTTNAPQLKIFNFQIIIGNGNAPFLSTHHFIKSPILNRNSALMKIGNF